MRIFEILDLEPILPNNITLDKGPLVCKIENYFDLDVFQNSQWNGIYSDPHSAITKFLKELRQFFKDKTYKKTHREKYQINYGLSEGVILREDKENKQFWIDAIIYLQKL